MSIVVLNKYSYFSCNVIGFKLSFKFEKANTFSLSNVQYFLHAYLKVLSVAINSPVALVLG
ncbi:hypothetical protein NPD8_3850 (plasmid) [Clostridium botulinum]|uniref:Uncharacterized protein n=1 Tax=Clostridium botulinum TaxID=1491 RepID=A0A1L7JMH8_CLOBO|nr:hypothetical protein NPD8_3850 [Clostridium botulinum]